MPLKRQVYLGEAKPGFYKLIRKISPPSDKRAYGPVILVTGKLSDHQSSSYDFMQILPLAYEKWEKHGPEEYFEGKNIRLEKVSKKIGFDAIFTHEGL